MTMRFRKKIIVEVLVDAIDEEHADSIIDEIHATITKNLISELHDDDRTSHDN